MKLVCVVARAAVTRRRRRPRPCPPKPFAALGATRAAAAAALSFLCLRGKYSSHAPHVEQVRSAGSRPQLPSPAARPRAQEAGGRLISAAAARRRRVYVL